MTIDVHVHIAGVGDQLYGRERCHLSDVFKKSLGFRLLLLQNGLSESELTDEKIQSVVLKQVYESKLVDKVVLLAMDRVYDSNHAPLPDDNKLPEKTQFYTPNECVADIAAKHPDRVLVGASVHPERPDAEESLVRAKEEQRAVLVKWLPSAQNIDPLRRTYRRFYRKLAELKLPLLWHAGAEHTIPIPTERRDNEAWKERQWMYTALNRPDGVIPALEEGVRVIVAHCALPVWDSDPDYTYDFLRLMYTAKENGWELYADLSALVLPSLICPKRRATARTIAAETGIHDRLVLGSDHPIWVGSATPDLLDGLSQDELKDLLGTSNALDRNVRALLRLGFPESVLANGARVLGLA